MSNNKLACLILAAGEGSRMKSGIPKSLQPLAGRPMIGWLLDSVQALDADRIVIVRRPDADDLEDYAKPHDCAVQEQPLGTADAVRAGMDKLGRFDGDILILLGDMPLISTGTMRKLVETRHKEDTGLAVLGAVYDDPPPFGRLVLDHHGKLAKIVEYKDCSADEKNIKCCNMGAFCVDGAKLPGWLDQIGSDNAQAEFYITDLPEIAAQAGAESHIYITEDRDEIHGVNDRGDLAFLENIVQGRLRRAAMENGATLVDPETVYFSWDTETGRDVTIEPGVFFGPGVTVKNGVYIKAYSYLEEATIDEGAVIGPFARIRPGSHIGAGSKIGNFVEVKNSTLGKGVKAAHLAYIGDAEVGADTNFSCGAITVNYDGFHKHKTVIGENVMVGSNVNLIAPVTVGDGAFIAAGTTLGKDVPADALAVAREKAIIKDGWAAQNRKKKAV